MGSVQFHIVPCSNLYFFSRSAGPFQCLVNANYRVSICCACHFASSSLLFVYFGLLCLQVSSVSNFHPDTRGWGGHLFRLTCSVVLWGGRNTANKYHWHVWGVLEEDGPHWVCHSPGWCVLPRPTLPRLQDTPWGRCPKWALNFIYFPGLSHSDSQGLFKGTNPNGLCVLCLSQVLAA